MITWSLEFGDLRTGPHSHRADDIGARRLVAGSDDPHDGRCAQAGGPLGSPKAARRQDLGGCDQGSLLSERSPANAPRALAGSI